MVGYFAVASLVFVGVLALAAWRVRGSSWSRVSRALLAAGFATGTVMHVENLLRLGWVPAPEQPLAFNVFWTSLMVLDPLAALLIAVRPRTGLVLGAAIMLVDLAVNSVAFLPDPSAAWWPIGFQAVFALFLAITAPRTYREAGS